MTDLSAEFEKISDRAKRRDRPPPRGESAHQGSACRRPARARNKATAAANQLKGEGVGARNTASSHWKEMRGKWKAHVAEVHARVGEKADKLDARASGVDADIAELRARCHRLRTSRRGRSRIRRARRDVRTC